MTKDEMIAQQRKFHAWRESEIGKLFESYDAATGNAWVTDCTSDYPRQLDKAWAKQREKKAAFLNKVCELAGVENPYT